MDAKGFMRECYLLSNPSVDLDKVSGEPVKCSDHKLTISVYEEILEKYCENDDQKFSCNMWLLCSGPTLVDDAK